jgi:hypothetical protein
MPINFTRKQKTHTEVLASAHFRTLHNKNALQSSYTRFAATKNIKFDQKFSS